MVRSQLYRSFLFTAAILFAASCFSGLYAQETLDKKIESFNKLGKFGYDFFGPQNVSAVPEQSIQAVTPDYQVKPGDEVIVEIWGDIAARYALPVTEDGYINVPQSGRIYLSGCSFEETKKKIMQKLASTNDLFISKSNQGEKGSVVDINLGRISGVKVYVSGQTVKKGAIGLKGVDSSILKALREAGGITPDGSLRNIQVKKLDGKVLTFDLYDFLLKGNLEPSFKYLKDGDIVFIPVKGKEVYISGAVRKPGVYELLPGDDLKALIEIAGGLQQDAITDKVQVIRTNPETGIQLQDLKISDAKLQVPLENQDMITIFSQPTNKIKNIVEISGDGIRKPGLYQLEPYMTLAKLIERAGGLYTDAYLQRAELIRMNPDLTKDINRIDISKDQNIPLKPMDQIVIFSKAALKGGANFINIGGHVKHPGEYRLYEGMNVNDLLFVAGGFEDQLYKQSVYLDRADIIRIDRKTQQKVTVPFCLKDILDKKSDLKLESGDTINVYSFESMTPKKFVYISGAIKKPGKYEKKNNMKLEDLLFEAGGLTGESNINKIEIARIIDNTKKAEMTLFKADLSTAVGKEFLLQDNDKVIIRERDIISQLPTVKIIGAVNSPGTYLIQGDEKIDSIIKRAEGMTSKAFPEGSVFIREGKRLVFSLPDALSDVKNENNIEVFPKDIIFIPENKSSITVAGEVLTAQTIIYKSGANPQYYIKAAGGCKTGASENDVKVILPNGALIDGSKSFFSSGPEVPIGSTVLVIPSDETKISDTINQYISKQIVDAVLARADSGIKDSGKSFNSNTNTTSENVKSPSMDVK